MSLQRELARRHAEHAEKLKEEAERQRTKEERGAASRLEDLDRMCETLAKNPCVRDSTDDAMMLDAEDGMGGDANEAVVTWEERALDSEQQGIVNLAPYPPSSLLVIGRSGIQAAPARTGF